MAATRTGASIRPTGGLAYRAAQQAGKDFRLGSEGAGYGATTVNLKGGLGSASAVTSSGLRVGALVTVNAMGSAVIGNGAHFWASPLEENGEFGNLGLPSPVPATARKLAWKDATQPATTIALVATDADLTKAQAKRLAIAAHDGLARALRLTHAPMDGDTVFSAATGAQPLRNGSQDMTELCATAADCLSRAIARGILRGNRSAISECPSRLARPFWKELRKRIITSKAGLKRFPRFSFSAPRAERPHFKHNLRDERQQILLIQLFLATCITSTMITGSHRDCNFHERTTLLHCPKKPPMLTAIYDQASPYRTFDPLR